MKYLVGNLGLLVGLLVLPGLAQADTVHHQVRPGETLQKISMQYFGTTRRWPAIFEQNKAALLSPDRLEPGITITFEGPANVSQQAISEAQVEVKQPHKSAVVRRPAFNDESMGTAFANIGAPLVQPDYILKRTHPFTEPSEAWTARQKAPKISVDEDRDAESSVGDSFRAIDPLDEVFALKTPSDIVDSVSTGTVNSAPQAKPTSEARSPASAGTQGPIDTKGLVGPDF